MGHSCCGRGQAKAKANSTSSASSSSGRQIWSRLSMIKCRWCMMGERFFQNCSSRLFRTDVRKLWENGYLGNDDIARSKSLSSPDWSAHPPRAPRSALPNPRPSPGRRRRRMQRRRRAECPRRRLWPPSRLCCACWSCCSSCRHPCRPCPAVLAHLLPQALPPASPEAPSPSARRARRRRRRRRRSSVSAAGHRRTGRGAQPSSNSADGLAALPAYG